MLAFSAFLASAWTPYRQLVAAQCIDVQTNRCLWAERVDGKSDDILSLHDRTIASLAAFMDAKPLNGWVCKSERSDVLVAQMHYRQSGQGAVNRMQAPSRAHERRRVMSDWSQDPRSRLVCYSTNSVAANRRLAGSVSPRAEAVLRLMTNSNLADCNTGRLEGRSPWRIRPA